MQIEEVNPIPIPIEEENNEEEKKEKNEEEKKEINEEQKEENEKV